MLCFVYNEIVSGNRGNELTHFMPLAFFNTPEKIKRPLVF